MKTRIIGFVLTVIISIVIIASFALSGVKSAAPQTSSCCSAACAGLNANTQPTFDECFRACMREKTGGGPCKKK